MKKILFLFVCLCFMFHHLQSQETTGSYNPTSKNFMVEFDFTPFNPTSPINLNGFRGKYFIDSKTAIRIGFNLDNEKNSSEVPVSYNNEAPKYNKSNEKYTVFGISPGFEYHFLDASRVSPYLGFEINYENKVSEATYEDHDRSYNNGEIDYDLITTEYKNAWRTYQTYTVTTNWGTETRSYQTTGERAYSLLGVNMILGADFNIVKHLYLGVELGFGYKSTKYKEIEITMENVQMEDEIKYPESKSNEFGLNVNNAIRLGFWF